MRGNEHVTIRACSFLRISNLTGAPACGRRANSLELVRRCGAISSYFLPFLASSLLEVTASSHPIATSCKISRRDFGGCMRAATATTRLLYRWAAAAATFSFVAAVPLVIHSAAQNTAVRASIANGRALVERN